MDEYGSSLARIEVWRVEPGGSTGKIFKIIADLIGQAKHIAQPGE